MRHFFSTSLLALSLLSLPALAQQYGAVETSETRLIFLGEQLRLASIEIAEVADDLDVATLRFSGKRLGTLSVKTNAAGTPNRFLQGQLLHAGSLAISRGGYSVRLEKFILRGAPRDSTAIVITDESGNEWFRGDFIHYHSKPDSLKATLKEMDLALTPWLAEQLGESKLAGFVVGVMEVDVELAMLPATSQIEKGAPCGDPVWYSGGPEVSDIRLTKLGKLNDNSTDPLQQRAREDGFVAVTVNAQLDNIGTADAPWYEKFRLYSGATEPVYPPYDNDQHPYLVWALYRETGIRLESIGFSPAKHAFYAVNSPCTTEREACEMDPANGRLLRFGCQDFYGIASNDNPQHLGPRSEIAAATGVWVSQGSFFDKDSNNQQDSDTMSRNGNLDRRMRVLESDLDTVDASYVTEAWYINRDDADIYNSMGSVEVDPELIGGGTLWTFPVAGGGNYEFGPAINQWVDPDAAGMGEGNREIATANGRLRVAAKTEDLGGGRYRYVYVVMNLDYDPQIQTFTIPIATGAAPADLYFADGDHEPTTDWAATPVGDQLVWQAPTGVGLDWGLMATFEFTTNAEPQAASVQLDSVENTDALSTSMPTPTGSVSDIIFDDGFE